MIEARIVVASVDTYLRYAEAVDRLDRHLLDNQGSVWSWIQAQSLTR